MDKLPETEHLLVEDVAAYLRVHPATIRSLMRKKKLEGAKVGRRWYVTRASLLRSLEESAEA